MWAVHSCNSFLVMSSKCLGLEGVNNVDPSQTAPTFDYNVWSVPIFRVLLSSFVNMDT